MTLTSIEICAGAGGQALGLERAGFRHLACVEWDKHAVQTLRDNRPGWNAEQSDVTEWSYSGDENVTLLAGGVPCPPFSHAGKQLGHEDERDLFPQMLRLADELKPRVVMVENVRGLLDPKFEGYRASFLTQLDRLGYVGEWNLLQASDFGVPQLRPRSILIAMRPSDWSEFKWPDPTTPTPVNVGDALRDLMAESGWEFADQWADDAVGVAPTLVGGSRKHGGADLGPTRARAQWLTKHGVEGRSLADAPPVEGFDGLPRLTVRMAAVIQGFPRDWHFSGGKTAAYRQVGNAFPPPVAEAVGLRIAEALGY